MPNDIEQIYQRSLPDFIRVLPDGFQIAGHITPSVEVSIQDEQIVKKLWSNGTLVCQSADGLSSLTTRKPCRVCRDQGRCHPQIVLYVLVDESPYRIALNYTSGKHYLAYRRRLLNEDRELRALVTRLTVVSRATWGEVHFQDLF